MAENILSIVGRKLVQYQQGENENNENPQSSIHYAAEQGNNKRIEEICEKNLDIINQEDKWGNSPLTIATKNNHLNVVKTLLQKGASQSPSKSDFGNTPLHYARDAQIASILINHGGEVNTKTYFGDTPLHRAAYQSNADLVKILLENNADVHVRNEEGMSPLHCVLNTDEPSLDIVRRLITAGANVNVLDFGDRTPLHHYCSNTRVAADLLKLLIGNGCILDIKDFQGNCPIHSFLAKNTTADVECLTLLCPKGNKTNLNDYRGRTPLCLATLNMDLQSIKTLTTQGAEVNLKDNLGKTALYFVSDTRSTEGVMSSTTKDVISFLISKRVDIHSLDKWGRTALFDYLDGGNVESCKILLKHGPYVNHQDKCGLSPLHIACTKGLDQAVEKLMKYEADINRTDSSGRTPLHAAATTDNVNTVKCLIDKSANKSVKDENGLTPCGLAELYCNDEIVSVLKEADSSIKCKRFSSISEKRDLSLEEAENLIEDRKCIRSDENLQSYYSVILNTPIVGKGIADDEAKEVQLVIEDQIQSLAKEIGKLDERFLSVVLHAGSSSEGTKTNFPDEFDFMFCLENFSSNCDFKLGNEDEAEILQISCGERKYLTDNDVLDNDKECSDSLDNRDEKINIHKIEVPVSDYVNVTLKDDEQTEQYRQIMMFSPLRCGVMNTIFSQLIERVIFSENFPRDPRLIPKEVTLHPSLKYVWNGSRYKNMIIDVDLVPALRVPTWPPKVDKDYALFDAELQNINCMAVPKTTAASDIELWRSSLALVETAIFRKLKCEVRNAYVVCKALRSSHFLPSIKFEDSYSEENLSLFKSSHPELNESNNDEKDDEPFISMTVEEVIPSYILKMAFLEIVEKRISQYGIAKVYNITEKKENVGIIPGEETPNYGPAVHMNVAESDTELDSELVKEVFQKCLDNLSQEFVPSVFNKKHNILNENQMYKGGKERATVFLKLIIELLREETH